MARIGTRRALLYRPPAASGGWWQVAGQTCVAAYQPKGAASLAASYVNLANPGTYDAAPGTAPTFATATGWTFNGQLTTGQYLTTGLLPAAGWSAIVRFSTAASDDSPVFGMNDDTTRRFNIYPKYNPDNNAYFRSGGSYTGAALNFLSGVAAVTASKAYRDGTALGSLTGSWSGTATKTIYIAALNSTGDVTRWGGTIAALAFYSTTLTDADVAALTTAMNAL